MLLALLARERDRHAVRAAVAGEATVRYVERVADLGQSWPEEGQPIAVLAELADADGISSARALVAFHQLAPSVPVCLYVPWNTGAVRAVARLAARGVATNVIVAGSTDLRVRLRDLLHHGHARSETAAVRRVWRQWTPPGLRDVVTACIAASNRAASVADVARGLNRSERTLERQLAHAGLPPAYRLLGWCRLLRAAYRLDRRRATVKVVAAELGYPSAHALVLHLHRHAGLTIADLRSSGGFRSLTACTRSELVSMNARAARRSRRRGRGRGGRGPGTGVGK